MEHTIPKYRNVRHIPKYRLIELEDCRDQKISLIRCIKSRFDRDMKHEHWVADQEAILRLKDEIWDIHKKIEAIKN